MDKLPVIRDMLNTDRSKTYISHRDIYDVSLVLFTVVFALHIFHYLQLVVIPQNYQFAVNVAGFASIVGIMWGYCKSRPPSSKSTVGGEDLIYSSIIGGLSNPFYQV